MIRFLLAWLLLASSALAQTDPLRAKVDSLFIRASSGLLKYRALEEASKKTLRETPAAIPYLVEKLTIQDARERRELINILGKMPDALMPVCSAALSSNKDIVKTASEILSALRDTVKEGHVATPYLLKARRHPQLQALGYAVFALGKWGGEGAKEALQEALADSVNFVRIEAAAGLGYLKETTTLPALIQALADEYYGVRFVAANSLAKFKNASLPHLYKALESEKPMVRQLSAETLGKMRAPEAVAPLSRLLKSQLWTDRLAAMEALAEIDTPTARQLLSSHSEEEPLLKTRLEELTKK